MSREVYREYGIVERTTGEYEVDHLVALEDGGSNDIANLWPEAAEPRPGIPRPGVRGLDESARCTAGDCH